MLATAVQLKPPDAPPAHLEHLFRDHHRMVFSAAFRITGSASEAEDVLQIIFLRLVQHDGAEQEKLTPAYLHRAAVNCALDVVRKRRNSALLDFEDTSLANFYPAPKTPDIEHEEQELRRLLRQAVARLSPRAAEVFALRYFEGKDNREIAEILDTSTLVVGVMLHRARTRLRAEVNALLEKHHEEK